MRTCISLLPMAPPTVSLMLPMVLSMLPCACTTQQRCSELQTQRGGWGHGRTETEAIRSEHWEEGERTREGSEPVMTAES